MNRRRFLLGFAALMGASAWAQEALRNVRLVVPGTPGSPFDRTARMLVPSIQKEFPSVEIENLAGESGLRAPRVILAAPPDGRTFTLMATQAAWGISSKFSPVAMLASRPVWFLASAKTSYRSIRELTTDRDKVRFDASGRLEAYVIQTILDKGGKWVQHMGVDALLNGLVEGTLDIASIHPDDQVLKLAKEQRVRVLALTSSFRNESFGAPSFRDTGHPELMAEGFLGMFAAPGVTRQNIERMGQAVAAALEQNGLRRELEQAGLKLPPVRSSNELKQTLDSAIVSLKQVALIGNVCEVKAQCLSLDYCRPPPCPN